jgi:hypothetical protein
MVEMTLPFILIPDDGIVGVLIRIASVPLSRQIEAEYKAESAGSFGRFVDKYNRDIEKKGNKRQSDL